MSENAVVAKPKEWIGNVREFFRDVRAEMTKVSWPARTEVVGTTVVVIVTTIVFGIFLWGCDEAFGRGVLWLVRKFGVNV